MTIFIAESINHRNAVLYILNKPVLAVSWRCSRFLESSIDRNVPSFDYSNISIYIYIICQTSLR